MVTRDLRRRAAALLRLGAGSQDDPIAEQMLDVAEELDVPVDVPRGLPEDVLVPSDWPDDIDLSYVKLFPKYHGYEAMRLF